MLKVINVLREGFKKTNRTNVGFWPKLGGRGHRGFEMPNPTGPYFYQELISLLTRS